MEPILAWAKEHHVAIIEDNAQAIGAKYRFSNGSVKFCGTIGDLGTTSFFPSKNLGTYGDGGAIFCNKADLFQQISGICDHGQLSQKYIHDIVGVNSRLDAIHAGILTIKLTHLDEYIASRRNLASFYTNALNDIDAILTPQTMDYSSHVYHQYTLKILDGRRDEFQKFLLSHQIPSMIYYPKPLHQQPAYHTEYDDRISLANSEQLSQEVISLPMHTHMSDDQRNFIIEKIRKFFV
jgi:dTDP-4-amino-4,6-dideoxygalactose transaminase